MDEELKEEDFIQDEFKQSPNPFLIGIFFVAIVIIILSAIQTWYHKHQNAYRKSSPFYQVTNRDFALFLVENPRFLKSNVSAKEAFLPGLDYLENISLNGQNANDLVDAPDNLMFQYHIWNRLTDYPPPRRSIPEAQFKQFLEKYQEWTPVYWKGSTRGYEDLYKQIINGTAPKELGDLPETTLPDDAREAFIGWKNFTIEKDEIKQFTTTFEQLKDFLNTYPNFQRNFWINLLKESDPAYLESYSFDKFDLKNKVPQDQIAPFLQIALFNFVKAKSEHEKK